MIHYLDTSAALKLLVTEPESDALAHHLQTVRDNGDILLSSMLLMTELHCAARRRQLLPLSLVAQLLDGIALIDLERVDLTRAATSEWGLRSADAIHLAVALRVEADQLVSYDLEQLAAASRVGLTTAAPQPG